jgi:hypothetical protein
MVVIGFADRTRVPLKLRLSHQSGRGKPGGYRPAGGYHGEADMSEQSKYYGFRVPKKGRLQQPLNAPQGITLIKAANLRHCNLTSTHALRRIRQGHQMAGHLT